MIARNEQGKGSGYRIITDRVNGPHADMLMDFGALKLGPKDQYVDDRKGDERAFVLIQGEVALHWGTESAVVSRGSFLDELPWVLHVPADLPVVIETGAEGAELAIAATLPISHHASSTPVDAEQTSSEPGPCRRPRPERCGRCSMQRTHPML